MDENKRKELQRIGYKIKKCCGACGSGKFTSNDWGTCDIHIYQHLKHSDSKRHLSIHKFGSCPDFKMKTPYYLGAFGEFI